MSNAETNRANAQHSTGPKTPEGKMRSSLNALRHGLTGQIVVMPSEDLEAYQLHVWSFTDEYNPQGATESALVQALADAAWRLNRVAAIETNLLSGITRFSSRPETELNEALSVASGLCPFRALSNLSTHSQRLSRQFERTEKHLRELQQIRKEQEKKEMERLLDIMETYETKGEPYDPKTDGFVFSPTKIDSAKRARIRDRRPQKRESV
jgi:hypothetical protein